MRSQRKRRHPGLVLVLALWAIALAGAAPVAWSATGDAAQLDPRLEEIRSSIVDRVLSHELPSMAVSVLVDDQLVWSEAFGWADREAGVPASLDSVYGLGSLSKSITATAMMVLVERGLVDLDAPVNHYLGDRKLTVCGGGEAAATVRQLLSCTAGIPHGWFGYVLDDAPPYATGDEYLRRFGLAAFEPGERFLYSNHAYGIAREIIANASGRSYEEFLRTEVFEPLGMRSSGLGTAANSEAAVVGYLEDAVLPRGYVTGPVGGAALFSSAADLMRYARFHLGRPLPDQQPILSAEPLDLMHRRGAGSPAGSFMALGWGSIELGELGTVLLTNGEVAGANATLLLVPARGIAVVCLANQAFAPSISDATAFAIADALAPGFLELLSRFAQDYESRQGGEYEVDTSMVGDWEGEISGDGIAVPMRLRFQLDGDIHVRLADALPVLLDEVRVESGLIVGTCAGSLPVAEHTEGGALTLHLAPAQDRISGYLVWITERIDAAGTRWPLVVPACVTLSRPHGDDLAARVEAFLRPYVNGNNFSGVVLVASGDEVLHAAGYGMANRELGVANSPRTRMRIGSISKGFTAAAIMLLRQRGEVALEDPVSRFIADFPNGDSITVQHLLEHTSGLPRFVFQPDYRQRSRQHHAAMDLVRWVSELEPAAKPGERYGYSNANYAVLAAIVEQVSGRPFGVFLDEELLSPLGLDDSGHAASAVEIVPDLASGYQPLGVNGLGNAALFDSTTLTGSGSMYSTVSDLLAWVRALRRSDIFDDETRTMLCGDGEASPSYAMRRTELDGRTAFSAQGWDGVGFSARVLHLVEEELTVVVLCNLNISGIHTELAEGLARIALGEEVEPPSFSTEPGNEGALQRLAGLYRFGSDFYVPDSSIRFVARDGHLLVEGLQPGALLPLSGTEFIHRQHWVRVRFELDADGRATGISYGPFKAVREVDE